MLKSDWIKVKQLTKTNRDQLRAKLIATSAKSGEFAQTVLIQSQEDSNSISSDSIHTRESPSLLHNTTNLSTTTTTIDIYQENVNLTKSNKNQTNLQNINNLTKIDVDRLNEWMLKTKNKLQEFASILTQVDLKIMEKVIQVINII